WSVQENSSTYRPLVILRPPPGHSFRPESTEQPPALRIRVLLECLCSREQLLGQMCFLHASGGELPRDQHWYLLDTICTGSYLDTGKVTCWVQMLVASAWQRLPHSHHCQLTVLPSSKCCSFHLSSNSGLHCSIEMALAVQQGSSGAILSLEE
ncbi:IPIL1 protein, partial [Anthoscopus minutus]|nr:IPIL1 protein [Anthoscopus minutus]